MNDWLHPGGRSITAMVLEAQKSVGNDLLIVAPSGTFVDG
jgi:uncharacterized protein (DUF2237 family)